MSKLAIKRQDKEVSTFVIEGAARAPGLGMLDPITVIFIEGPGSGRVIVSCSSQAWSHRLGRLPDGFTTAKFFLHAEPESMADRLLRDPRELDLLTDIVTAAQAGLFKILREEAPLRELPGVDPIAQSRDSAGIMARAFAMCPTDMAHPDRMRWMASYFETNLEAQAESKLELSGQGEVERPRAG
jgi:hypothetical protein